MTKKLWNSRIFRFWVAGYLIVMMIPMVFLVIQHERNMQEAQAYAYTRGNSQVKQLAVSIDEQIKNVLATSDAIAASSTIRKLRYCNLPMNAEKYYEVHQRIRRLSDFSGQSDLINGLYLYSSNLDSLLDYGRIYPRGSRFDNLIERVLGMDAGTFDRIISERHLHDLYMLGDGRKMLLMKTVSTVVGSDKPSVTLLILIDTSPMKKMIQEVNDSWKGSFQILLPDEMLLTKPEQMEQGQILGLKSRLKQLSTLEDNVVSMHESDVTRAVYVLSVPKSVFFMKLSSDRAVFLLCFLLIVLMTLFVSVLLARKNYGPIQILKETAEIETGGHNEFCQITQRFRELRTNADELKEKVRRLEGFENERLFGALLEGDPERLKGREAEEMKRLFDRHYLLVLLVDMDRDDGSSFTRSQLSEIIRESLQMKCADIAQSYIGIYQTDIACIMCFPDQSSTYDIQLFAKQIMKEIISEHHQLPVSVFIGDAHEGCPGIQLSFDEAVRAREYTRFVAETEKQVVVYDQTMYSAGTTWDSYDIVAAERNLISMLLNEEYDPCEKLVSEIMTYYTAHEGVSLYVMRYRMFSIMNMMMNVLREVPVENNPQNAADETITRQLMTVRTMQELEDAVQGILKELRNSRMQELNCQAQKLDQVEQYIRLHYQDPNLSVQQVATAFDMSLPYLSREFKNSRGIGVLTYINRFRIEKAKALLRSNRQMTVAEIAEAVGYNSSQTLIRIFKRYEDSTPGQFRLTEEPQHPPGQTLCAEIRDSALKSNDSINEERD